MSAFILHPYRGSEVAPTQSNFTSRRTSVQVKFATLSFQLAALLAIVLIGLRASGQAAPASLVDPVQGTVLPGSTATFSWPASSGATAYMLYLGTTGTGSSNLFNSGSITGTSIAVGGIPANGLTVYARLSSNIGGVWEHTDSTYLEAGTALPASLISPASGSQLPGTSATFSWTPGAGASAFMLYVGTKGSGSSNLYNSGATAATSAVVTGIPANGSTVYARLFSMMNGAWELADYTFAEAGTPAPVQLISPAPGSQLTGSAVTFSWSPGSATAYRLFLGTNGSGSDNLFNSGTIAATSATVSGLPISGNTLFARLQWKISGAWQSADYTFTEAGTASPAMLTSPASGSQLTGSSANFTWTQGTGVSAYKLYLGTSGAGSSNLFNSSSTTATSVAVSGLPTNGVLVYARLYSSINGEWEPMDYTFTEAGTPAPATMISPAPGSQLSGTNVTFSWTPGVGTTQYMLYLGTKGAGSSNLFNSGAITATSASVSGLPANGSVIYAKLSSSINGSWEYTTYTFVSDPPLPALGGISCSSASITGSASDTCTVTLTSAASGSGTTVNLASSSSAVTAPAAVSVPAGASSASFTVNATAVSIAQTALLTASLNGASTAFTLQLNAATMSVSTGSVAFGNVMVNSTAAQSVSVMSTGNVPVTVNSAGVSGSAFAVSGASFPMTLNPGQSATLTVQFNPTAAGAASGMLTFSSNASTGSTSGVSLSGTGAIALTGLSCGTTSFTGSGTSACSATLNAAAPTGGTVVSLVSSSSAVTVPASITVAAGVTSASFTASAASVSTAQTASITATAGGASSAVGLQLNAATPGFSCSAASVAFGNVAVNTATNQTITMTSTGNVPVTLSSATVSGAGFTVSGMTFPVTLNPGQSASLTVQFDPTAAGPATATLTISSNASAGAWTPVSLSGTGTVNLTALTCASSTFTGSGTDACTVTLSAAAPSGGVSVSLASSNSAVAVPASITVPANATSAGFPATVNAVSSAQSVNLTATENSASMTFALQLNASVPTLSLSASSVGFGSVTVNSPSTQSITLTATGSATVTISSATLTGAGFSLGAENYPITLTAGQSATMEIEFDPSAAGAATGQLSIASNSSTGTAVVSLTGTGTALNYEVNLSWVAPSSPSDPIAGYNVYRAASGSTMYQLLNSSVETGVAFVDTTIQAGSTYDYYVESIDNNRIPSVPSATVAMAIP